MRIVDLALDKRINGYCATFASSREMWRTIHHAGRSFGAGRRRGGRSRTVFASVNRSGSGIALPVVRQFTTDGVREHGVTTNDFHAALAMDRIVNSNSGLGRTI